MSVLERCPSGQCLTLRHVHLGSNTKNVHLSWSRRGVCERKMAALDRCPSNASVNLSVVSSLVVASSASPEGAVVT